MATTSLTRNLKLRINSNLTADAKYNLERLDLLGSTFLVDSTNGLNIRGQTDIVIEPESADVDGSGVGGSVSIGTASHTISLLNLYASEINLPVALGLKDQATSGTKYLRIKYKTDLNGPIDTTADRNLSIDLEGADRSLVLGGSLSLLGGSLTLNLSGTTSVILPLTGTLSTLAGVETLTNKSMSGLDNTFTNIQYASLNLSGSIVNADIANAAAIAYSKLALTGSIVNSDVSNSAAIVYSKLNLLGSLVNADISNSAAIAYSKLSLSNSIINADISAGANIARSKIAATTANQVIINDSNGLLSSEAQLSISRGGTGQATANAALNALLPDQTGQLNKVLQTDGTNASWQSLAGSGTVTSVGLSLPASLFSVSGSPVTSTGTLTGSLLTQAANLVWAGPTTGPDAAPTFRSLVVADIPSGIDHGGLAGLGDDDHNQYHTDARALTWLGTRSTTDLPEGSNLYFTNERVDDRVAALIQNGTGITWTYDDTGNTLTGNVTVTQYTDEQAQDAVGTILVDSSNIDFTYNDGVPSITADLTDTTVTPGSFGSASSVATYTVDQKGRLTASGQTAIAITSAAVTDFNEAAQDAVGGILTDTASVNLTYNDAGNSISADVIPGGVDHDQLLNFVANEHVDHSTVNINTAANSGLSGGGDITASRSLLVDSTNAPTVTAAAGDLILIADVSDSNNLKKVTASSIAALASVSSFKATWLNADGATKVVTHNLNSTDVIIQIFDNSTGETIEVDTAVRTDANNVTLTASVAPTVSWRVLILQV